MHLKFSLTLSKKVIAQSACVRKYLSKLIAFEMLYPFIFSCLKDADQFCPNFQHPNTVMFVIYF